MSNDSKTTETKPEAEAKAEAERSKTTITVAAKDYELAGLSVDQGTELYGKLPKEYQQLADVYASLAQRFQRKLDVKLPGGMSLDTAWNNTVAYYKKHGSMDGAEQYQKDIYNEFRDALDKVPVVGSGISAAETTGKAMSAGTAFIHGGFDGIAAIPRLVLGAGGSAISEGVDAVSAAVTPISDAQAKAFGAAMAGAVLHESVARKDMGVGSSLWNYPMEHLGAAGEWATLNIPGLNAIWPYLQACAQIVKQWFSSEPDAPKKEFGEFVKENQAAAEKVRSEGKDSYNDLFEARARAGETSKAADIMRDAQTVAGIETDALMDVAEEGGPIVNKDGDAEHIKAGDAEGPKVDTSVDMGEEATRVSRLKRDFYNSTVKPLKEGLQGDHALAYGAGLTAVGGPAVYGTVEGLVRGAVNQRLDAALNAEAKAKATVDNLQARHKAATEGKKTGLFGRGGVESVSALDAEIEKATNTWVKAQQTLDDMGIDTDKVKDLKGADRTEALRKQYTTTMASKGGVAETVAKVAESGNKQAQGWHRFNLGRRIGHAMGDGTARVVGKTVAGPVKTFGNEMYAGYEFFRDTPVKQMGANVFDGLGLNNFTNIGDQYRYGYLQGAANGADLRLQAAEKKLKRLGDERIVDPEKVGPSKLAANERHNAKIEAAKADVAKLTQEAELHRWGANAAEPHKPKGRLFVLLGDISENFVHTYNSAVERFTGSSNLVKPTVAEAAAKPAAETVKKTAEAPKPSAKPAAGQGPVSANNVSRFTMPGSQGFGDAATASAAGSKPVVANDTVGFTQAHGNTALKAKPATVEVPPATKPISASSFTKPGIVPPAAANDAAAAAAGTKGIKLAGVKGPAIVTGVISGGIGAFQSGKNEYNKEDSTALSVAGHAAKGIAYDYETRAGLASLVGTYDFQDGDWKRGFASLPELAMIPTTQYVDANRYQSAIDTTIKHNPQQFKAIHAMIPADKNPNTGDMYLDRLLRLKEMESRGVKEVTLAEPPVSRVPVIGPIADLGKTLWNGGKSLLGFEVKEEKPFEYKGKIQYEGPTVREKSAKLGGTYTVPGTPLQEAFDMNLAQYLMNGGSMKKLEAALEKKDGALGKADAGLAAAATERAQTAAKPVAKPMLAHSVKVGAVKQTEGNPDSGLLGGFSINKLNIMKGDFNPFA